MPSTPIYAFPYPTATDPADGPGGFSALALAVEGAIKAPAASIVTTLPASPVNGQRVTYWNATANVAWDLVYVAAAPGPYRWFVLGGTMLSGRDDADVPPSAINPAWVAATPQVAAPLAGVYQVAGGCIMHGAIALNMGMAVTLMSGTIGTPDALCPTITQNVPATPGPFIWVGIGGPITVPAAGSVISSAYTVSVAGGYVNTRILSAMPLRVG